MRKVKIRFLLTLGIFILTIFLPLNAQELFLSQLRFNDCSLRLQADFQWEVLTVKISHPDCPVSQDQLLQLIKLAASYNDSVFTSHSFASLFIGRMVEYPWLSNFVVRQALDDSVWSRKRGRPRGENINVYVAHLIEKHPFISHLDSILSKIHYKIKGVSVEKVLVGTYKHLLHYSGSKFTGGVPFDAQVYLLLQPLK